MANTPASQTVRAADKPSNDNSWLELVNRSVAGLRYGVVMIVVHDGKVTQVEKTERWRLDKPALHYEI